MVYPNIFIPSDIYYQRQRTSQMLTANALSARL